MPRQDYILEALKSLKVDIEKIDDKFDKKLSNIEDKMHKQELATERVSQHLEVYNGQLGNHMARTEAAENRQDQYETALALLKEEMAHQKEINKSLLAIINPLSNWMHSQQERSKGVKIFWSNTFTWIKRAGIAAGTLAACYGGYEILLKVFQ